MVYYKLIFLVFAEKCAICEHINAYIIGLVRYLLRIIKN